MTASVWEVLARGWGGGEDDDMAINVFYGLGPDRKESYLVDAFFSISFMYLDGFGEIMNKLFYS